MPNEDEDEDMQARMRKSGALRDDSQPLEAYTTNQGTVIMGTPADIRRAAIFARAKGDAVLRPRWSDGDYKPLHQSAMQDPELDIDWGIHKAPQEDTHQSTQEETVTAHHGRARGGPYNTMSVVHFETVYRIAIDANNPLNALPGQVASTIAQPCLFGSYLYNEPAKEWIWDENSVSETR